MEIERVACSCAGQWLYLFGEEGGVVYSAAQGRFVGLDAAGVAAFLALDAGMPLESVQAASLQTEVDGEKAPGHILESIYELAGGIFPSVDSPEDWPEIGASASADAAGMILEVGGIPVSVQVPRGPLEKLCGDYFQGCRRTVQPPRCYLTVQSTESQQSEPGWTILVNGREFMRIAQPDQLGLGLMHAARSMQYHQGTHDVAFHAAMVADENCGLLLCAPCGSGKSTLAAYLTATGFDLLADEPALLQLDSWSVQPMPLPISLKQGSWSCLQTEWPQLGDAPIHTRSDEVPIRLLHMPEKKISPRPQRITHFVFPQYSSLYSPSSPPLPERLTPLRALCLLNHGGLLFARNSTEQQFERFLDLLCRTPAFTLPFSSLTYAGTALRTISQPGECHGLPKALLRDPHA